MKSQILLLIALLLMLLLCSCAGGRVRLNATQSQYPISGTRFVHNQEGEVLSESDYTVIKKFDLQYSRWSILWTMIPFSPYDVDISKDMDSLIVANNGDAIINVTMTPKAHPLTNFTSLIPGIIVPIIPTAITMEVRGDIIKRY